MKQDCSATLSKREPVPVVPKYWTLTPYGNKMMMKLKAIKKENSAK